jgi:hypothetical protein
MKLSKLSRRGLFVAAAFAALSGAIACEELGRDPQLSTMMLYFPGGDTVLVDIESGVVSSGPITMFSDVDFSAEFFAGDGTPDSRVTEVRFRLDLVPANPAIVSFTRVTQFSGSLNKLGTGTTNIRFALYNLETMQNEFDLPVDVEIN